MKILPYFVFVIFAFIFLEHSVQASAFYVSKQYGNVTVRLSTVGYTEANKAFIVGQLANKLTKELKYKDPVFLDFEHTFPSTSSPVYCVSFDKGEIYPIEEYSNHKSIFKQNVIVIRQISSVIEPIATLKLLEYALLNKSSVKETQKLFTYNKYIRSLKVNSIDTTLIRQIVLDGSSQTLRNIIKIKVEVDNEDFRNGVSYFWQNDTLHFYVRKSYRSDTTMLKLKTVFQFSEVETGDSYIIFNTDSTFYYINAHLQTLSKNHTIKNKYGHTGPYNVRDVGKDKASIHFSAFTVKTGWPPKERVLLYLSKEDSLITDLDKLINDCKNSR